MDRSNILEEVRAALTEYLHELESENRRNKKTGFNVEEIAKKAKSIVKDVMKGHAYKQLKNYEIVITQLTDDGLIDIDIRKKKC